MAGRNPLGFSLDQLQAQMAAMQQKLSNGMALLPQVDDVAVGVTAREQVWRDGKVCLYRFVADPAAASPPGPPLLVVYALINLPYMIDLQDGRSLVQRLLALGHDVYVIDWGYADRSDRFLRLEDYLLRHVDGAVRHLCQRSGQAAIDLLGVCQGGVFSLCYAALQPERVRNLITMVTPVDFHTPDNVLGSWARAVDARAMVNALGNIPADLMNISYLMLKPFRLNLQKYMGLLDILDDPAAVADFLRMEKWIFDSPDLAGEAFVEFIEQFYQANGLVNGTVRIGQHSVDLARVTMPVLNLYAEADHLVPPSASRPLATLVGSDDYTEQGFAGGHIGIYVSSRAQREVPATIDGWLRARQ